MSDALPFKISDNHWRLWKKTKTGNWTPKVIEVNVSQTGVEIVVKH